MSEIESPEVIEPIATIAPEITHEEIIKTDEQPATNHPIQIEVATEQVKIEQPEQVPIEPEFGGSDASHNEIDKPEPIQEPEQPDEPPVAPKKRKGKKGKKQHAQEDNNIDTEFASRLDMSCTDAKTVAPHIENAHVASYAR